MKNPSDRRRLWAAGTLLTVVAAVAGAVFGLRSTDVKASPVPAAPAATSFSTTLATETGVAAWDEFSGRLEAIERTSPGRCSRCTSARARW